MSKTIVLRPRISEKAYAQSQTNSTYVFVVPRDANKMSIEQAVTAQFGVSVVEVNILNVKGKAKRTVRKGGRAVNGRESDFKKAYVTLKAGDSIPVFATEEEAADKPAKKEKK